MKNLEISKLKTKNIIIISAVAVVVVLLIAISIIVTSNSSKTATPDESIVVSGTEIVTEYVEVTDSDSTQSESNTETKTDDENTTTVSDKESSSSSSSTDKKTSGNSENSEESESKSSSSKTNDNSSQNYDDDYIEPGTTTSEVLSVDGNDFYVGEIITCTVKLTSPDILENYQAEITYDSEYLSVESSQLVKPGKSGGMINSKTSGKISFNGSNISEGYDYTDGGTLVRIKFRVKAAGKTSPEMKWIVATQFKDDGSDGKAYVKDGKLSDEVEYSIDYESQD